LRVVKQFLGGLVFKAHIRVYHSTPGKRVKKKKKKKKRDPEACTSLFFFALVTESKEVFVKKKYATATRNTDTARGLEI